MIPFAPLVVPLLGPLSRSFARRRKGLSAYSYVAQVLVEKYDVDKEKIRPEATLTDLGLDSLLVVEFLFDLEDEFDIEVPEDQAEFETLGEAVALIDELVKAKGH